MTISEEQELLELTRLNNELLRAILLYGNEIKESLKFPNAIRQMDELISPKDVGITYTENKDSE